MGFQGGIPFLHTVDIGYAWLHGGAANERSLLSPVHSDKQCRSLSNSSATKSLDGVGGGWVALHGFEGEGSWKIKAVGRPSTTLRSPSSTFSQAE
jgi:hypothetical protein